jgi:glucosamine kinase
MVVTRDSAADLILAVDAGGTKTAACIAQVTNAATYDVLGRGRAVGANPLSIGFDAAVAAISAAAAEAVANAQLSGVIVARAVVSVAGAADPAIARELVRRATNASLARQVTIVSDVVPILVAGCDNVGVALIAGTGSVAYGRAEDGRLARCGGWGYLLGDDGSGFAIGRAAFRLALDDLETGRRGQQAITTLLLDEFRLRTTNELISAIYTNPNPRAVIASLARHVGQAAELGDAAAHAILDVAARDLARLAQRTAELLRLDLRKVPLAVAGGVLIGSAVLREAVASHLAASGLPPRIRLVADPVDGCLRLAVAKSGESSSGHGQNINLPEMASLGSGPAHQ